MNDSAAFIIALNDIKEMHLKKSRDYGRPDKPFANVQASEDWGIPDWIGTLVRANDKIRRLQAVAQGSKLANEGVEDSLIDLATYAVIALTLYRQGDKNENQNQRSVSPPYCPVCGGFQCRCTNPPRL
jgi:formate dehydrogenase maturation protein FdhE